MLFYINVRGLLIDTGHRKINFHEGVISVEKDRPTIICKPNGSGKTLFCVLVSKVIKSASGSFSGTYIDVSRGVKYMVGCLSWNLPSAPIVVPKEFFKIYDQVSFDGVEVLDDPSLEIINMVTNSNKYCRPLVVFTHTGNTKNCRCLDGEGLFFHGYGKWHCLDISKMEIFSNSVTRSRGEQAAHNLKVVVSNATRLGINLNVKNYSSSMCPETKYKTFDIIVLLRICILMAKVCV